MDAALRKLPNCLRTMEGTCANCSNDDLPGMGEVEPITGRIFPVLMVLIAAVGITGNSLVLHIIFRHRDMRTVTNSFVASLALSDIAMLTICVIPTATVAFTETWELGDFLCKAASYTSFVSINPAFVFQ